MSNYSNAFTEVYTILHYLDINEYNKISQDFLEIIEKNRNKEYNYEINENIDLRNQKMLKETKAILFNIFRDYLCTKEQKDKIIKWQKEERQKNEFRKKETYNKKCLLQKEETFASQSNYNSVLMTVYKESIFTKIKKWFQNFLGNL